MLRGCDEDAMTTLRGCYEETSAVECSLMQCIETL